MVRSIYQNQEMSFSINNETNINDVMEKLFLESLSDSPFELFNTKYIQVKKHKKRRINKKWAKKYGYREVRSSLGEFTYEGSEGVPGAGAFTVTFEKKADAKQ